MREQSTAENTFIIKTFFSTFIFILPHFPDTQRTLGSHHIFSSQQHKNTQLLTISCRVVVSKCLYDVNNISRETSEVSEVEGEISDGKLKVGHIKMATKSSNKHWQALRDKKCR